MVVLAGALLGGCTSAPADSAHVGLVFWDDGYDDNYTLFDTSTPGFVELDASGDRFVFPMRRTGRSFATRQEFLDFVADELNASVIEAPSPLQPERVLWDPYVVITSYTGQPPYPPSGWEENPFNEVGYYVDERVDDVCRLSEFVLNMVTTGDPLEDPPLHPIRVVYDVAHLRPHIPDTDCRDYERAQSMFGFRYELHTLGRSYFLDLEAGVAYEVTDPIAAHLGGLTGEVSIEGNRYCVDPDQICAQGYPSYLSPVAIATHGPVDFRCSADLSFCTTATSFYNKAWSPFPIPFQWARHGVNTSVTLADASRYARIYFAWPSCDTGHAQLCSSAYGICACIRPPPGPSLRVTGRIQDMAIGVGGGTTRNTDQHFVEWAVGGALFGVDTRETGTFPEYAADGVCGAHASSFGANALGQRTGNGVHFDGLCP